MTRHKVRSYINYGISTLLFLSITSMAHGPDETGESDIGLESLHVAVPQDLAGKHMTVLRVEVPSGASMAAHRHPGSAFVYVLEGSIRSRMQSEQEPVLYRTGEYWFEAAGENHQLMDNPSAESAKLIAILFSDEGDKLVLPAK